MKKYIINPNEKITFKQIFELTKNNMKLELSPEGLQKIEQCRDYLDKKVVSHSRPIYGITTGFGSLCNVQVSNEDLEKLQENLVMSHACGLGEEVPTEIVKLMMLLKIQSLSYGHSGVQSVTVQRLIDMYNNDVIPVVYQQGSLGASGDLSPLAHLSLPLLGKGEVRYNGENHPAANILARFNWSPIKLKSKEGLALLNGTQFMSAFGVHVLIRFFKLSQLSDLIGAMSLDAFDGCIDPFGKEVNEVRQQQGQIKTAEIFRTLLEGSQLIHRAKEHVQDPYSFRCIPQVHGASKDGMNYITQILSREINAVTDNPTIFVEEDIIVSAGNFHGQPLALSLDFLAIVMAELANISERRTYQLISGKRGLPSFLVANPGLNSGFMIPQYTAASIVSQNKQLCMPASVDSIVSSQGQEDHVSMGANAATKAFKVMENLEKVLAIELFNASQALEFRRPLRSSHIIENFYDQFRNEVPFVKNDLVMYEQMHKAIEFLRKVDVNIPDGLDCGI